MCWRAVIAQFRAGKRNLAIPIWFLSDIVVFCYTFLDMGVDRGVGLVDRELSSWKEIAAYLGVSIRTAQGLEERGLPVRRLSGPRGRVTIGVNALEEWKRASQVPGVNGKSTPASDRIVRRVRTRVLYLAGFLTLLGIGVVLLFRGLHSSPRSSRVERDALIILDDRGVALWRKSFPALDPSVYAGDTKLPVWIGDLDGDGKTEVLFVPCNAGGCGPLLCYSSSGEERWHYLPHRAVHTRREVFLPPFSTLWFTVARVGPRGALRVIVGSRHHTYYPMQVALLSPDGRLEREYWHSGYLDKFSVQDVAGDGHAAIILGGVSNGSRAATLVVLDPDSFGGASEEENTDYQLLGFPKGVEKARLLFPRTCINTALDEPFNFVSAMQTEQDGIAIAVTEQASGSPPVIYYHLNAQLRLRQVDASTNFAHVHAQLRAAGMLDHDYDPKELDELDPIRYLTGRMTSPHPGH